MNERTPGPGPMLRPIDAGERIGIIDALRGFALLGILLMNIEAFAGPLVASLTGVDPALSGADRSVDLLVYVLVQGKFYTLFSLLFGMGFAVMSQRAERAGRPFAGVYWRRGLVLLGFGVLHALLVWSGDILMVYALLSFLLLAFRNMPRGWLPWLGVAAYLAPVAFMLAMGALGSLMALSPESAAGWNEAMGKAAADVQALLQAERVAYGSGGYAEATLQRGRDVAFLMANLPFMGAAVLGMFLLGAWFVHSGAIAQPERFPCLYALLRWLAWPLGLAVMLGSVALEPTMDFGRLDLRTALAFAAGSVAALLMCLGYAAWVVRAWQSPAWRGALAWLAPAGRMALTNYLMQSVVCTLVFYHYGLGYFEQLPRAWQPAFVLALFALQVLWSRWWLARFHFGPAEWLWRSLTYLRAQPMRVTAA